MIMKTFMVLKNGILKQIRQAKTQEAKKKNIQLRRIRRMIVTI